MYLSNKPVGLVSEANTEERGKHPERSEQARPRDPAECNSGAARTRPERSAA